MASSNSRLRIASSLPLILVPLLQVCELSSKISNLTFAGVAIATPSSDKAELTDIHVITSWGKGKMANSQKIPSVLSYSIAPNKERQWGFDFSDDAVTMVNTKLELDVHEDKLDELELIIYALDGMRDLSFDNIKNTRGGPAFTWKSPELIVLDFFLRLFAEIETKFPSAALQSLPVDIVITTPVVSIPPLLTPSLLSGRNGLIEPRTPRIEL
jgi:hypothetical protein